MGTLMQDLRYGLRMLAKNPGFSTIAVLTLALGIGANTAIFSIINAVLLKPLHYPNPDRLVMLWERSPAKGLEQEKVTGPDFIDWRRQNHAFESLAFWPGWLGSTEFNLVGSEGAEKVKGVYASSDLFPVLGVKPLLGRTFLPEEDQWQPNRVAVISHKLWQSRFGAAPTVLGRTLTVDTYGRRDYTIVGVMPRGFRFPGECELWLPAGWMGVRLDERRSAHWHSVIARLKPGVTLDQARSDLNIIQARIAQDHPGELIGSEVAVVPLLEQTVGPRLRPALFILWASVACVLLIACANLANLLLARGAGRQKEIAVRIAVGATRLRVTRQLLTESILLSLAGGAIGVLWASWALSLFITIAGSHIPRLQEVTLDNGTLAFTLGVSLLTGLLFGFAPAWQTSKPDLNETLKDGARSGGVVEGNRLRPLLVIFEIALSLVLLVGAGLMTQSFVRLLRIDRGFQSEHLLTAELDFSVSGFTTWVEPTPTRPQVTVQQIMERLRNYPAIESVAAVSKLPRDVSSSLNQTIVIENRPPTAGVELPMASFQGITPDYFRAMSIPLLQGRGFTEDDVYEAPQVAIINRTMANRFFRSENPIGKRLVLSARNNPSQPYTDRNGRIPWIQIVGVMADMKSLSLSAETMPDVYVPYWQWPMQNPTLLVRTAGSPAVIAAAIRSEAKGVNKNLPLPTVRSMAEILAESVAQPRDQTMLVGLFGITGLILAAVGIYGVTSYTVSQRTREIGIRMALGANRNDVLRLVVGQGFKLTLLGVGIGILSALGLTRFLSASLYGIKATDPMTFALLSLVLASVALIASYIPARRATKVDAMLALRHE